MNTKVYKNDIDEILTKCFDKNLIIKEEIKNNNTNVPFAMKQFKTMYGQFLYRKEINKRYQDESKKVKTILINSFDEIKDENYENWISLDKKKQLELINNYFIKKQLVDTKFATKFLKLFESGNITQKNILYNYKKNKILKLRLNSN